MVIVATFLIASLGIAAWTYVQTLGVASIAFPPVTARERELADRFWNAVYVRDWRPAYDVFPDVLHAQMAFPNFVKASSYALGQFARPPVSRHFESAEPTSGILVVSGLAQFDD